MSQSRSSRSAPPGLTADSVAELDAESAYVDVGDVTLHTVVAGPEDGPPVVLLHGFPECWYGWHRQIRPLADAGFRVLVPDQRGYNLSAKPGGVDAYGIDYLAGDVVGLLSELGYDEVALVGHDWGAAVAWWTALHHPDRLGRVVALNVPHPTVFERTLRRNPRQQLKSWYVLFFQLPSLPERIARLNDWAIPTRALRDSARPGTFSATDLDRYRTAWSQSGAYAAMVNWYRAIVRERPTPREERVRVPTRILWGARDQFLERSMARESLDFCDEGSLRYFEEATHWVQHEEATAVAEELIDFCGTDTER
ncbi:alpha/beta hydrolase [Salinigranum marinum]|uniref:alpha/beta fold hydrolase n=1 Tax=Salinigranum marinum TaxID=1515595 RepID=UPI002989E895|nr:alpha/beta hydrolase [Salinigranum marinum]